MHLVEDDGEREGERLVDVRFDQDLVLVLSKSKQLGPDTAAVSDLRNRVALIVAAATGDGHRAPEVAAVDAEVGDPLAGGVAVEEDVHGVPHLKEARLVDGDEEPVRASHVAAPERFPPLLADDAEPGLLDS